MKENHFHTLSSLVHTIWSSFLSVNSGGYSLNILNSVSVRASLVRTPSLHDNRITYRVVFWPVTRLLL